MYFKNGRVKVELALAKGKQLWDKRETERRRTADKEAREAITRSRKRKDAVGRKRKTVVSLGRWLVWSSKIHVGRRSSSSN